MYSFGTLNEALYFSFGLHVQIRSTSYLRADFIGPVEEFRSLTNILLANDCFIGEDEVPLATVAEASAFSSRAIYLCACRKTCL